MSSVCLSACRRVALRQTLMVVHLSTGNPNPEGKIVPGQTSMQYHYGPRHCHDSTLCQGAALRIGGCRPPPPPQIITARAVMIHVEQAVIFCIVSWAYQAICVLLSFV